MNLATPPKVRVKQKKLTATQLAEANGMFRSGDDRGFHAFCLSHGVEPTAVLLQLQAPPPARAKGTPRPVACPVCEKEMSPTADVCPACAADLEGAERHVHQLWGAVTFPLQQALEAWDVAYLLENEEDRQRYERLVARRAEAPDDERVKNGVLLAQARGDGLSRLLAAEAARDAVASRQNLSERQRWMWRALDAIKAARDA